LGKEIKEINEPPNHPRTRVKRTNFDDELNVNVTGAEPALVKVEFGYIKRDCRMREPQTLHPVTYSIKEIQIRGIVGRTFAAPTGTGQGPVCSLSM
jgi:hypothetical protein